MNRELPFRLYLITDRHQTSGRPLLDVIKEAVDAGVTAVQLREKDLSSRDLFRLAEQVRAITEEAGALLFINDRIDLCLAVGANGVHLRSDHLPVGRVRAILGPSRFMGVSCHSVGEVLEAEQDGADFVVLGPIYDTPSKRGYGGPLGKELIQDSRSCTSIPILAIGGINLNRITEVINAGASGVAVISNILGSGDVPGVVGRFNKVLVGTSPKSATIDRMRIR